ncbi:hypothetical protein [Dactylosporangium cerinum]
MAGRALAYPYVAWGFGEGMALLGVLRAAEQLGQPTWIDAVADLLAPSLAGPLDRPTTSSRSTSWSSCGDCDPRSPPTKRSGDSRRRSSARADRLRTGRRSTGRTCPTWPP